MTQKQWERFGLDDPSNSPYHTLARRAAGLAVQRTKGAVDRDDAYMDCLLYLVEHPASARKWIKMQQGGARLYAAAINNKHRDSSDFAEHPVWEEPVMVRENTVQRGVSEYTEDEVSEMLVLFYAPSLVEIYVERTGEEDMPRAASNPAEKHTAWARLADISWALPESFLTVKEERCAFLLYVMEMSSREAGRILEIDHKTVTANANNAIKKITATLNGKDYE